MLKNILMTSGFEWIQIKRFKNNIYFSLTLLFQCWLNYENHVILVGHGKIERKLIFSDCQTENSLFLSKIVNIYKIWNENKIFMKNSRKIIFAMPYSRVHQEIQPKEGISLDRQHVLNVNAKRLDQSD